MTLLSGSALHAKRFFRTGPPSAQASSFDLTIGKIFDHDGKEVEGPFTLKPRDMVQVVSAEVFNLDDDVTGHVTYKTSLTRVGIWALTVGIVDPGWDGPISTTLLNFSKNDYTIHAGDKFLRVSFFEHEQASRNTLRRAPKLKDYHKELQKLAASTFPKTFLDTVEIAESAGGSVLARIRTEALVWIAGIAILFTLLQVGGLIAARYFPPPNPAGLANLRSQMDLINSDLNTLKEEVGALTKPSSGGDPASTD